MKFPEVTIGAVRLAMVPLQWCGSEAKTFFLTEKKNPNQRRICEKRMI